MRDYWVAKNGTLRESPRSFTAQRTLVQDDKQVFGATDTMISVHFLFLALSLLLQQQAAPSLESVLKKMDAAAANFHTAQADFVWEQYQKVVDETDTQKGTVYYRRAGKDIEWMAEIKEPDAKFVLYKDGKLQMYQPKIEQVTEYPTGSNRSEVESYLVLGFGGSGQDLMKSFDVSYLGEENVAGIATAEAATDPKEREVPQQRF